MIRPGCLTASTVKLPTSEYLLIVLVLHCRCSFLLLVQCLGRQVFPRRRAVGYDWARDRAHLWRNGVEHLKRSAELRG